MKRQLRVELGHAWLVAEDAARLGPGSEIPLLNAPSMNKKVIWSVAVGTMTPCSFRVLITRRLF